MEPAKGHVRASRSSALLNHTPNFEAIFRVPSTHSLVLVRSRGQGSPVAAVDWEHHEHNASGRLVARYESFEQVDAAGERRSGWQKFAPDGQLLGEGNALV